MSKTLYATATMVGMIVGVGIFGVPYVTVQAGFFMGVFWMLLLGGVTLLMSLFYSEVVFATPGRHRLVGYAWYHLGPFGMAAAALFNILSFWGAQVAYIIVGGQFLFTLLSPIFGGDALLYHLGFFAVMAVLIAGKVSVFKRAELVMAGCLIALIAVISLWAVPRVDWRNLTASVDFVRFLAPYGVILFALGGASAVPGMIDIVGRRRGVVRRAIILGSLISLALTILFTSAIVAVTGHSTTPEVVAGLQGVPGSFAVVLAVIAFGVFAIASSYLVLGVNLKEVFQYDLRFPPVFAWIFAVGVPALFFLFGTTDFISVIDYSGALFGGIEALLILLMFLLLARRGKAMGGSFTWQALAFGLAAIFIIGIFSRL
ncbi:MAG: aromatic amino acid transport family protein [Patescibacteria group bacterium]